MKLARNERLIREDIHRLIDPEIASLEEHYNQEISKVLDGLGVDRANEIWLCFVGYAGEGFEAAYLLGLRHGSNPVEMFRPGPTPEAA